MSETDWDMEKLVNRIINGTVAACAKAEGLVGGHDWSFDGSLDVIHADAMKRFATILPRPQRDLVEIERFRTHLEDIGRPIQIARQAVINRAREVAALNLAHTSKVHYTVIASLVTAVWELDRQEANAKAARTHSVLPGDSL